MLESYMLWDSSSGSYRTVNKALPQKHNPSHDSQLETKLIEKRYYEAIRNNISSSVSHGQYG